MSEEKIQLTVQGVLEDLQNGLTREDIGEKYGLNKAEVKRVFQHPKLKNKKTIKPREERFILIDEEEESSTADLKPEVEETQEESSQQGFDAEAEQPVEESRGAFDD